MNEMARMVEVLLCAEQEQGFSCIFNIMGINEQIIQGVQASVVLVFIQYFARNWPWYRLRGLHIEN